MAADTSSPPVCDIEVVSAFKRHLYVVNVDGIAYKSKRYLGWGDASALRDVLIGSGACRSAKNIRKCAVGSHPEGGFTVYRGEDLFDHGAQFAQQKPALEYAHRLAKQRLCTVK